MSSGSARYLNWRTAIIAILGGVVILFLVMKIINTITYPVLPAAALFPKDSEVMVSATLKPTDQGLVAFIREVRQLMQARSGSGGGMGGFLARLSGQANVEDAFPMVVTLSAWKDPQQPDRLHVCQAQSLSHFVVGLRWSLGCRQAPKGDQKTKYGGESLFIGQAKDEKAQDQQYAYAMAQNNRLAGSDPDVIKRLIDKVHSGKTDLDVGGELAALYQQYQADYPFVLAALNDRGQMQALVSERTPEGGPGYVARAEEYLGVSASTVQSLAAGAKVASSDRLEAAGVLLCKDPASAQALADAMNAKLQVPAHEGRWSIQTTATVDGNRVSAKMELKGLKELAVELLSQADQKAREQGTAAAAASSPAASGAAGAPNAPTAAPSPPAVQTAPGATGSPPPSASPPPGSSSTESLPQ